ncbi:MAG: hypothetical protein GC147_05590 [Porphyrobacter sp.]|nr:hypothetical protein [Porphyrobacter sp.]
MSRTGRAAPARGAPLVMMGLLVAGWIAGRALTWESPFTAPAAQLASSTLGPRIAAAGPAPLPMREAKTPPMPVSAAPPAIGWAPRTAAGAGSRAGRSGPRSALARRQAGPFAMRAAVPSPGAPAAPRAAESQGHPPFLAATAHAPAAPPRAGRWSLDAWGFWREGSNAAPVSQGRVPIYGASQAGALLQYRLAPGSGRDPRLHLRGYKALVRRGESEVALGASVRPLARVPLRVFGEVRFTDGAFRSELRPAVFAVTELPPIALPLGARLEAYAQGGWVGGAGDTPFADGQASLTREVGALGQATDDAVRLSLGAAAWGGAQEDAQRVDVGPTLRLDMRVGDVPARLSLDWRERVGGDAGPDSGLAVTLSTRF